MKNLTKIKLAVMAAGVIALAAFATTEVQAAGFYDTGNLFRGSISNSTTLTASVTQTNTTTFYLTNSSSGVITTNSSTTITPFSILNTNWIDLSYSPGSGGVCPLDIQIFCVATNNSSSNVIVTLQTTVNKRKPVTATISVTNALTGTTNSVGKTTISAATLGNPQAFRLLSISSAHLSTISAEVDYGYWRPKE